MPRKKNDLVYGANSLTGGRNVYSAKTKLGNWVEEEHIPGVQGGSFLGGSQYVSTTRQMQMEGARTAYTAIGGRVGENTYGEQRFDYDNIISADRRESSKNWQSLSRGAHADPKEQKPLEFKSAFKLKGGAKSQEELEAYRNKWTRERNNNQLQRFHTEKNTSLGIVVAPQFRAQPSRWLRGAPISTEKLREKIISKASFAQLFYRLCGLALNGTNVNSDNLAMALKDMSVPISPYDLNQTWLFLQADVQGDKTELDVEHILRTLNGTFNSKRCQVVECLYKRVCQKLGEEFTGHAYLSQLDYFSHPLVISKQAEEDEISQEYKDKWRNVVKAQTGFLEQSREKGLMEDDVRVSLKNFKLFYADISATIFDDDLFQKVVEDPAGELNF